ncbi:MAG: DUF2956 domain-containing protein [Candidatus Thiodiazotropha sp. (ex Epidulcina cf. delphinae)]|nr:DUF2956 domain-containing protein [Candidatus Thiodiazotropha sp. (ex Epidulcina cf. delphinae)]
MTRYSKKQRPSEETAAEAMKIARAMQRPGQTKEQTKLIANGIQKGIDHYKKQQKAKLREMDKRKKKERSPTDDDSLSQDAPILSSDQGKGNKLPWVLLLLSWLLFAVYLLFSQQ